MPLQRPTKKKPKPPSQPKMYISDRPSKSKKNKKVNNSNGTMRNSFGSTNAKVVQINEQCRRDTSKSKKSLSKKKKKSKRESLNSRSTNLTKSGLIQPSKFSSYEKGNSYEPSPASISQPEEYNSKSNMVQKSIETTDESSSQNHSKSDPKQSYFYRKHPNNIDIQETQTPDSCIKCMRFSVCSENSELCGDCFNKQSSQSSRSSIINSTPNEYNSSTNSNEIKIQNNKDKQESNEKLNKTNNKSRLSDEDSKIEDKSDIYGGVKNDSNSYLNEYMKTKTPINESKGELLEEFITPDVNSESVHLTTNDLKEDQNIKTGIGWNEVEPELPSDSYFIMFYSDKNACILDDHTNTVDMESSNDISNSESSTSKNLSALNSSSQHKKLFYCKPEPKKSNRHKTREKTSEEEEESEGIHFPQIALNPKLSSPYNIIEYTKKSMPDIRGNNHRSSSGALMATSVAHVCIEEAKSEEEEETDKFTNELNNQTQIESSIDDVFEYSIQDTANNLTNN